MNPERSTVNNMSSAEEKNIGYIITHEAWKFQKSASKQTDSFESRLSALVKITEAKVSVLYRKIFNSLTLEGDNKIIQASIENLSKATDLMQGLDRIIKPLRDQYLDLTISERDEQFLITKAREEMLERALRPLAIKDDRVDINDKIYNKIQLHRTFMMKQITDILTKWKTFAYNNFFIGVNQKKPFKSFVETFYNENGSVKIGSSIEGELIALAISTVINEKVSYMMHKANENAYKYCWNANPMDMRTKDECIAACLAGTIHIEEMERYYGLPPRYICRCELVYVSPAWAGVNEGVNMAIEERRRDLIQELEEHPKQKSEWTRGKSVLQAKDPIRAAGDLSYQWVVDRLKVLNAHPVPEFTVPKNYEKESLKFSNELDRDSVRDALDLILREASRRLPDGTPMIVDPRYLLEQ